MSRLLSSFLLLSFLSLQANSGIIVNLHSVTKGQDMIDNDEAGGATYLLVGFSTAIGLKSIGFQALGSQGMNPMSMVLIVLDETLKPENLFVSALMEKFPYLNDASILDELAYELALQQEKAVADENGNYVLALEPSLTLEILERSDLSIHQKNDIVEVLQ